MINKKLKKYLDDNIIPLNNLNDLGHDINHIKYVIRRSLKFAEEVENINLDMVYTVAVYHDVCHHIDHINHEEKSGDFLFNDKNLREFFLEEEIITMRDAVKDHRASSKNNPRSIYGRIVSSADRNTSIDDVLRRTYLYRISHSDDKDLDSIINESKNHIISKFCSEGYATKKMFFKDLEYERFLLDIDELCKNDIKFINRYKKVNNLK